MHLFAELLHVVGMFDAITHAPNGTQTRRPAEAIERLQSRAGISFSSEAIALLCKAVGLSPDGTSPGERCGGIPGLSDCSGQ